MPKGPSTPSEVRTGWFKKGTPSQGSWTFCWKLGRSNRSKRSTKTALQRRYNKKPGSLGDGLESLQKGQQFMNQAKTSKPGGTTHSVKS